MAAPKKTPIEVPVLLNESEIEGSALDLHSQTLEAQAQEQLSSTAMSRLKKIAYYVAKVGLPLQEACALVDVDYEKFKEEMQLTPLIGKIIKMKELEYKKDLMYTISQRAKSGDDKLAQWLLERRWPDEFSAAKRGAGGNDGEDVFFSAIEFIRKNGDNNGLVNESAGRAVVVKGNSSTLLEKIGIGKILK